MLEQVPRRSSPANLLERRARLRQIREHKLLRQRAAFRTRGGTRAGQRMMRAIHKRDVPHVRHGGTIAQRIHIKREHDSSPETGDWEFFYFHPRSASPNGKAIVWEKAKDLKSCASCHCNAPDMVFGRFAEPYVMPTDREAKVFNLILDESVLFLADKFLARSKPPKADEDLVKP